jgi:preprotein translocase subunit Sss1
MSETEPNGPSPGKTERTEKSETDQNVGGIIGDIERFSRLSSELKDCLSGITRKIIDSLDELKSVQQDVAQKKQELKELYDIEASAEALQYLDEEHRLKQSEFEGFMEGQRRLWEEEKNLREKEDKEYRQVLKMSRKREEEEYKHKLAGEELAARQKLEEELLQLRQRNIEKQELLKQDLLKREKALKEKELEWVRLIQELELFMTGLVERTRKKNAGSVSDVTDPGKGAAPMHGDASAGFKKYTEDENKPGIAEETDGKADPSVASVREMLLSQGRRIENIQDDLRDNREPVPFRLLPKDIV